VPEINELHEKFATKGLSILGVTGESASNIEPWIERHEVAYAWAYDPPLATMEYFGRRGFPSAVLIGPDGTVVWKGHPASLDEELLEKTLEGARAVPIFELPGYDRKLREELAEEHYTKAYKRIDSVDDPDQRAELLAGVDTIVDRRLRDLETLFEVEGDYLTVKERCKFLKKRVGKLPMAERVAALQSKLRGKQVTQVLRAQEKVRKLLPEGKRLKDKQRIKVIKELNRIIESYPDTGAARDAQAALRRISR